MANVFDFPDIAAGITQVGKESLNSFLESKRYTPGKIQEWMEAVNSTCVERLKELSPNFKYISSTIILQKTGAGLHYDCASHWDTKTDGAVTSKFENDTILAINTVFAVAL